MRRDGIKDDFGNRTGLFWPKVSGMFGVPMQTSSGKVISLVAKVQSQLSVQDLAKWPVPYMSRDDIRKMLKVAPSVFRFGVHIPRNDTEADRSPERVQWRAGRTLEWLRMKQIGAFDGSWTKERLRKEMPEFQIADIGHVFFLYNYKCTGEFRVRLVYDGSRQSPNTYGETYAPTVRPESIRLFHLYCIEHHYDLGQYDVPQAFLRAEAQGNLFFYPPPGCGESSRDKYSSVSGICVEERRQHGCTI